jgi:cholesterol oxidase
MPRLEGSSSDVIVIGSGFGGAVTACRLAATGKRVVIFERGPARTGEEFPRLGARPSKWLWTSRWDGFFDFRMFKRIATLTASGVGGGSHTYANVHIRAPERSFRAGWPTGLGPEVLAPYYERAERMLGVRPLPESIALEKTTAYTAAARAIGAEAFRPNLAVYFGDGVKPNPDEPPQYVKDPYNLGIDVLQSPCRHCGECDLGCRFNSKNTLDLNYLAVAQQRYGAILQPLAEVKSIVPEDGGYRVNYLNRHNGLMDEAWAPLVVVAAGTVSTNELLLRCRDEYKTLPNINAALGRNFSGNGDFLAATVNAKEPLNPWHGPTITLAVREMNDEHHFYLEEGGFAPDLAFFVGAVKPRSQYARKFIRGPLAYAARLKWFYREVARLTGDNTGLEQELPANTMIFLGMGEDGSDGRVSLKKSLFRGYRLNIDWKHDNTRALIDRMETQLKLISKELGGQYVANPLWTVMHKLVTVHPLGGCGIADDPEHGPTNSYGEVWGYPNLFVADGSVVPRAIGPNPALTIAALAERTAEHIVQRGF